MRNEAGWAPRRVSLPPLPGFRTGNFVVAERTQYLTSARCYRKRGTPRRTRDFVEHFHASTGGNRGRGEAFVVPRGTRIGNLGPGDETDQREAGVCRSGNALQRRETEGGREGTRARPLGGGSINQTTMAHVTLSLLLFFLSLSHRERVI